MQINGEINGNNRIEPHAIALGPGISKPQPIATRGRCPMTTPTLTPPDGIPLKAWEQLAKRDGNRWAIKERDATGEGIGTAYRLQNGEKHFKKGGNRGLIYPEPLNPYAGSSKQDPIFVCEGASDTAALIGLELDAVGIPMTGQCGEMLAELLKGRHVVVVRDADEAGRNGAERIIRPLLLNCDSVRAIDPPLNAKDAREAVLKGATTQDFLELALEAAELRHAPLASEPGRDEFTWVSASHLPPYTDPPWLWQGYLARGAITLLTGIWKGGKTVLITHLLRDLYVGTGLCSKVIEGPTLVVSEEPLAHWAGREQDFEFDQRVLYLKRPSFARCDHAQWRRLIKEITTKVQHSSAEFVIIDALPNIWAVTNENDAAEVSEAISIMRDISEAGAALLLVHHPRKGDSGLQTASRGSGALPSFADILVDLGKLPSDGEKSKRRLLKALGRFGCEPAEQVIELTDEGYAMRGAPIEACESDQLEILADILRQAARALSYKEITELWPPEQPIGKNKLREILRNGAAEGRWSESGKGGRNNAYRYEMLPDSSDSSRHGHDTKGTGSNLLGSSVSTGLSTNLIEAPA